MCNKKKKREQWVVGTPLPPNILVISKKKKKKKTPITIVSLGIGNKKDKPHSYKRAPFQGLV